MANRCSFCRLDERCTLSVSVDAMPGAVLTGSCHDSSMEGPARDRDCNCDCTAGRGARLDRMDADADATLLATEELTERVDEAREVAEATLRAGEEDAREGVADARAGDADGAYTERSIAGAALASPAAAVGEGGRDGSDSLNKSDAAGAVVVRGVVVRTAGPYRAVRLVRARWVLMGERAAAPMEWRIAPMGVAVAGAVAAGDGASERACVKLRSSCGVIRTRAAAAPCVDVWIGEGEPMPPNRPGVVDAPALVADGVEAYACNGDAAAEGAAGEEDGEGP